jgi:hypothetical protein
MRQRFARLMLAASVAVLAGLAFASPASAADGPADLNKDHIGATASGFSSHDCTGGLADIPAGYDGWHFVLPHTSGSSFVSATLTFSSPGGSVTVGPITSTDPDNPDGVEPLWQGYIDNAGASGSDKHLYVITQAGWTLTGGTAIVKDAAEDAFFNLSHTCPGTPSTSTPTPGTSETPTPGTSETPSPGVSESSQPGTSVSPSPSSSSGGGLPVTGVAWGATALTAVGLIAAGVALMAVRRRRELTEENPTEL